MGNWITDYQTSVRTYVSTFMEDRSEFLSPTRCRVGVKGNSGIQARQIKMIMVSCVWNLTYMPFLFILFVLHALEWRGWVLLRNHGNRQIVWSSSVFLYPPFSLFWSLFCVVFRSCVSFFRLYFGMFFQDRVMNVFLRPVVETDISGSEFCWDYVKNNGRVIADAR